MRTITATELARNTSGIIDQVAGQGETIVVECNRTIVARITPEAPRMDALDALTGLEGKIRPEDGDQWLEDSQGDFDDTVRDPWR